MSYTASAAVCSDGMTTDSFEKRSAAASGKTVPEWREAVRDALASAKKGMATARQYFNKQGELMNKPLSGPEATQLSQLGASMQPDDAGDANVPLESTQDLDNILDGTVKTGFSAYGKQRLMWAFLKANNLAYEKDWQHMTSVSFIETKPDGVNKKGKPKFKTVRHSAEADKEPYVVQRAGFKPPAGTLVKVTDAQGNSTFARVLEAGPNTQMTEASLKVYENLGYQDVNADAAPAGSGPLTYDIVAQPGKGQFDNTEAGGHFDNSETQLAGDLAANHDAGFIGSRQQLYDAAVKTWGADARAQAAKAGVTFPADMQTSQQIKAKKDEARSKGGGVKLDKSKKHGVVTGFQQNLMGYAENTCLDTSGAWITHGSSTVSVALCPAGYIGSEMSNMQGVVTGDDTVQIGGVPTTARMTAVT